MAEIKTCDGCKYLEDMRCSNKEGHYFRGFQCSKYAPQNSKEIIAEQLSEIAENLYREAETVPVVTERDETEQSETEHDAVNSPSHYCQGGIECIEALKAATVNLKGIEAVCTANAIKYLWRWKEKNGTEDLKKSIWYIKRLIQEVSENG